MRNNVEGCTSCHGQNYCRFNLYAGMLVEQVPDRDLLGEEPTTVDMSHRQAAAEAALVRVRADIRRLSAQAIDTGCPNVEEVLEDYGAKLPGQ